MQKQQIEKGEALFFAAIAALAFILFLGAPPLFDWDEINFAESAREMMVSGDYFRVQINFQAFWEKPPLFFWMQVLSMKVFGVNEFAARFPNALIGIITILSLYYHGSKLKDRLFGRILVGFYFATILPVAYFKSGIIDPTFNFFIFLGLINIFHYERLKESDPENEENKQRPWGAGFWIGMATLTKGPVALLVSGLTYGVYKAIFDKFRIPVGASIKFFLAWLILVLGWYGLETFVHGPSFVTEFIEYQIGLFSQNIAGHQRPFYYHFFVFCLGCFPMAAFAFRGMFIKQENPSDKSLWAFMLVWFWVVMILFSVVTTKIVHYSSLLYFPGAFLAAFCLYSFLKEEAKAKWDTYLLMGIGIIIWGLFPSLINWIEQNLASWASSADEFTAALMRAEVDWTGWEWMIGAFFLLGSLAALSLLIQKKYLQFLWVQVLVSLIFINLFYKLVVPNIGLYSQGAPQEFFEERAGEDAYYITAGYKSYLPYFYGKVKPITREEAKEKEWLISGPVDKTVYLSAKKSRINEAFHERFRNFELLYSKGGFSFYRRKASIPLRANTKRVP
ncbi:MAG: glycosyltransferase family 39 protein [Bacteroidota bacterium]